jgi:charged multivesicular body protein 7
LRDLESKEWGRPLALGAVVQESIQRREIIPVAQFQDAKESIYRNPWSLNPLNLVGWGLRQLGLVGASNNPKLVSGKFVVVQNLEDAATELAKRTEGRRGRVERIYARKLFKEEFRDVLGARQQLSDADMELFLRFLQRDKGMLVWDSQTVKLRSAGDTSTTITQEEHTIASLTGLIRDLESQTKILGSRVEELGSTAREAVSRKNKVSALAALRSKKLAESTLTKRHATLSQLEEVLLKIEQAADQIELVRVMEGSAKVLAGLNKEVGGVDRVDQVLDGLREQMGQVEEIGTVIAEAAQGGVVDEGEVDDELEMMENEEKKKQEEREKREKEEKERREAEETRQKLAQLEEIEKRAKEDAVKMHTDKEKGEKGAEKEEGVKEIDESAELFKRMSLDPPEQATA